MRNRRLSLLASLALAVAACGGAVADDATTTSTEAVEAPEAVQLAYSLAPGTTLEYEVDIDQTIDLTTEGEGTAFGEEEIPGNLSVNFAGTTAFTYSVAGGRETGTYEVTITGDFSDLTLTGTVDGEPVETGDLPEFAELEPIDITIVVDEQGNIITDDEAFGDILGGDLGGLGSLGDMAAPGMDPGRFIGPPFTLEGVTVGDTWSETIETPGLGDDEVIATDITSEVTGTDTIEGVDVFVIETKTATSAIEFDLAEFLIGFFTAFVADDASEEELARIGLIKEELRFAFSIDPSTSEMTTWFDAGAGVSRQAEFTSSVHMVMDINMPDEESGKMAGLVLDMSIDQDVTYRLVGTEGA